MILTVTKQAIQDSGYSSFFVYEILVFYIFYIYILLLKGFFIIINLQPYFKTFYSKKHKIDINPSSTVIDNFEGPKENAPIVILKHESLTDINTYNTSKFTYCCINFRYCSKIWFGYIANYPI